MVKTIVQNENVFHAVVVIQMKPNSSLLETRTSSICSSETFVCLMKSSRDKFSNIIANMASGRIIADEKDRIRIKVDLSVQLFCVAVRKGRCETMKTLRIFCRI